ncbi:D-glycerate dehydrogenase [Roseomonas sp. OT10]|uniref:2-hydroxyacid dehydrogenase n=1 Tax=Roseomonas cutis TaxID=2897332 RepID=UPI001E5C5609|nr:D-glycerate dehydrogenase [Roseomonas sp. OT10]UFN48447.1 D-glycerate dehydrogenase [Roseomonas sp. OT10]
MTDGKACRILLTRALPAPVMDLFHRAATCAANPEDRGWDRDEILRHAHAHAAEALVVMAMDRIDAGLIEGLPASVRVIATYSVGHDHIDLEAARSRGLAVLSTPDVLSDAVADLGILLLLGAARRAREGMQMLYDGAWTGWSPTQLIGRDLSGGRLGIVGMGRIGRAIARRARNGFGMAVHYHNRSRLSPEAEDGAAFHPRLDDLLAVSDFLMLAAPVTPETRGMLDARAIGLLPAGAVVANVSRGDLVDDEALIAALAGGRVMAAGLDVFRGEPDIHPGYLALPNVFLQPHQGSSTIETRLRMGALLLDSILRLRAGEAVANRLA